MKLKFAFLAVVLSCFSYAQILNSFEEVEKLRKENPKPVVVLFTTEWCGVCRVQKKFIKTSSEHMGQRLFYKHKP